MVVIFSGRSTGTATLRTAALAVGSHPLTATYSGDANFITSAFLPPPGLKLLREDERVTFKERT